MAKTITESGMDFIVDNAFHIEKSDIYTKLNESIKTVEFIRAKDDKLLFVEAKSSFPNPNNPKSFVNFQSETDDICDKFVHSLNLYASILVGVNEQLMSDFNSADRVYLDFVLVLNNFEKSWCVRIKDAITNQLRKSKCMAKIWKPEVSVINCEMAQRLNLIIRQ